MGSSHVHYFFVHIANPRSTGIGWNVMLGNLGGLISTWSYLPFDAPNYAWVEDVD